jgi:hypothetical protein
MNLEMLAESEIARHPWPALREIAGPADRIPDVLRALLAATSSADAEKAYWRLENHVVVQGQLYEAAVATTHVVMAALVAPNRPSFVRTALFELLLQIVSGESHQDEVGRGRADLGPRCREAARQGLWVLYRELLGPDAEAAAEVLGHVEVDLERYRAIAGAIERSRGNGGTEGR